MWNEDGSRINGKARRASVLCWTEISVFGLKSRSMIRWEVAGHLCSLVVVARRIGNCVNGCCLVHCQDQSLMLGRRPSTLRCDGRHKGLVWHWIRSKGRRRLSWLQLPTSTAGHDSNHHPACILYTATRQSDAVRTILEVVMVVLVAAWRQRLDAISSSFHANSIRICG